MMVTLQAAVKQYGAVRALDSLDLSVRQGELYALLGPNGAGKTTAIRILTGLTRLSGGVASIAGLDVARHPVEAKRLCGLAPQSINLDGELTLRQNLDFHGRLYRMTKADRLRRTAELLDYVELADRADAPVKTLSGGMKRRLMLARALLHQPLLVFLDEPTVGLDPAIRRRIWHLVKKIRRDGVTVVLTTHYIEEAEFLADRVGFLNAGRLATEGTPRDLIERLGQWAVDRTGDDAIQTTYFPDRDAANRFLAAQPGEATLRRINLEDAFLSLTGRRVG
ncbi:MAG: ABC transporter ATP-binding protein [Planctomycetaceae bacterium]|nr:ABC transporter ATP-binding protein [Planctomycetaceae bacterium]